MCRACSWAYCTSLVCRPPNRNAGCISLLSLVLEEHQTNFVLNKSSSSSSSSSFFFLTSQVILHDPIYTLYLTYTDTGITGHIFIKFHTWWFHGAPVFSCSLSTSLLTSLYSPSDEKPHFLKHFSMVVGIICLQASGMKWRTVRRLIFYLDASPSTSPLIIATAFRMSCSYRHLKAWMIPISSGCKRFVQFGGKTWLQYFSKKWYLLSVQHICQ